MIKNNYNSLNSTYNKVFNWIIFCTCIIILVILLVFKNTYTSSKIYTLQQYGYELNDINHSLNTTISDNSNKLNLNKAKNLLSNGIIELNILNDKLSLMEPTTSDETQLLDQLVTSVDNTIAIYEKYEEALNSSNNLNTFNYDSKILFDTCKLSYSRLELYNINIEISDSTQNFFNTLNNYIYAYNWENTTKDSLISNNVISENPIYNYLEPVINYINSKCSFFSKIKDFLVSPNTTEKIHTKINDMLAKFSP